MLKLSKLYITSVQSFSWHALYEKNAKQDKFIMYPATVTISAFNKRRVTPVILETPEELRNRKDIHIDHKLCNRAASRILEVSYRLLCRSTNNSSRDIVYIARLPNNYRKRKFKIGRTSARNRAARLRLLDTRYVQAE